MLFLFMDGKSLLERVFFFMCENNIFDNINGYSLDEQQRKAATSKSKFSMIIAGAGSGKSTTMVGKVKYLVKCMNVKPTQILCISFTNESAISLKENIYRNCNIDIDVKTFHKLGLDILKENNVKFTLTPLNFLDFIIDEYFKMVNDNIKFKVIQFLKNSYFTQNSKIYEKLKETNEFTNFKKLIKQFLYFYFTKYNNIDFLKSLFVKSSNYKENAFYSIVISIYQIYEIEKKSQGLIDFDDMINLATTTVNNGGIVKDYKYIIIDEFQDTSEIRFNLVKSIIKRNASSLTVVGDDFQSIYRFSGCNLNLFLNFKNEFPNTEILKIENTYRNSQELIKVAGDFIMRNKEQLKKNLKSNKHINKPIKIIYENNKTLKTLLYDLNKTDYKDILLLGRNNFDISRYLDEDIKISSDGYIVARNIVNKTIRFLSVHKSKGLEADIVIILNLTNHKLGFPNKTKDHKLLNCFNSETFYPFDEERRLFYVALTRTKNDVYLLTQKNNTSIFVKELLKYHKKYIDIIKF